MGSPDSVRFVAVDLETHGIDEAPRGAVAEATNRTREVTLTPTEGELIATPALFCTFGLLDSAWTSKAALSLTFCATAAEARIVPAIAKLKRCFPGKLFRYDFQERTG